MMLEAFKIYSFKNFIDSFYKNEYITLNETLSAVEYMKEKKLNTEQKCLDEYERLI